MRGRQLGDALILSGSESAFSEGQMKRTAFIREVASDGAIGTVFVTEDNSVDFAKLEFDETDLDGYTRHFEVTTTAASSPPRTGASTRSRRGTPTAASTGSSLAHTSRRSARRRNARRPRASFGININGRNATILTAEVERCVEEIYARPDGRIWVEHDKSGDRHDEGILLGPRRVRRRGKLHATDPHQGGRRPRGRRRSSAGRQALRHPWARGRAGDARRAWWGR